MITAILPGGRSQKMEYEMVPMGEYFYEITLEDVEFINLLAE